MAPNRTLNDSVTPECERVIAQAKSLDDFLSHQNLIEAYFDSIQGYYGENRFSRESFDVILTQLIEIKDKIDGFKERLWETTDLGEPFTISAGAKTYGRKLNVPLWQDYLTRWHERLKEQSQPLLKIHEVAARNDKLANV